MLTRPFDPGSDVLCRKLGSTAGMGPSAASSTFEFRLTILDNLVFSMLTP